MEGCVEEKKRLEDVDLLRGFGVLLMVLGHIGLGGCFEVYIHAFHMPLWFVISGYFFNREKSLNRFLIRRVKGLLIPYFSFALFYEALNCLKGEQGWLSILFPNRILIPFNESLWFLPALFIADVFVFVIFKYLPKYLSWAVMVFIAFIGSLHIVSLPFCADSAMVGAGFFAAGVLLRRFEGKLLEIDLRAVVILFVINAAFIFLNGYVNMRENCYGNILLFWLNAVLAVVLYWNIFKKISLKSTVLAEIGAKSLLYVCLNQFIIYIVSCIIEPKNILFLILRKLVGLTAVFCVCFFLNRFLEKTPLKFLTGK